MSIEIHVDRELCIGSGTCARLARGAFVLDDEEIATVGDPSAVGIDALRLAAEACPTGAITVKDRTGDRG